MKVISPTQKTNRKLKKSVVIACMQTKRLHSSPLNESKQKPYVNKEVLYHACYRNEGARDDK
ncbi:hypothetical protein ACE1TH_05505 [Shouchella sp. JSM 1781072]|uniref:hypothetical protein n=1 Tax=Bacillaceae TaxID=186817 RepID=UPI000C07E7D2|nr:MULTISPECIES: hypothetical protein [Bacillaceae]UTR08386.1 hypothetical protein MM326_10355 [Alkalihalobacillus sp. LMS6]